MRFQTWAEAPVAQEAPTALALLAASCMSQGSLAARCSSMRSRIACTVSVGSSYCTTHAAQTSLKSNPKTPVTDHAQGCSFITPPAPWLQAIYGMPCRCRVRLALPVSPAGSGQTANVLSGCGEGTHCDIKSALLVCNAVDCFQEGLAHPLALVGWGDQHLGHSDTIPVWEAVEVVDRGKAGLHADYPMHLPCNASASSWLLLR